MNKSKNVCLGRRGRPKKGGTKKKIEDYISALLEVPGFSFYPLERTKVGECKVFGSLLVPLRMFDLFPEWFQGTFNKINCFQDVFYRDSDLINNEGLNKCDSKDMINISFVCEKHERDFMLGQNKGLACTECNFMPYIIKVDGHIWKLAFSAPINNSCIFLAVSLHPENCPVTEIFKRYSGPGVIQIWNIPFTCDNEQEKCNVDNSRIEPYLKCEVYHNKKICRYVEWIPFSDCLEKGVVGLLFTILGDFCAYIYLIPINSSRIDAEEYILWSYKGVHCIYSASICIPSPSGILRIAGTTLEGNILIWTFQSYNSVSKDIKEGIINPSEQIISVTENRPILSASWCPGSFSLLCVGDINGKITIIDYRRCMNHLVKEFDLSSRPITNIVWCRLTNNIYVSHGIGAIVISLERGDYTQFAIEAFYKKKSTSYNKNKTPILGARSWSCCSLIHYAIFGFNDGSTIIGPCFEFDTKSFRETMLLRAIIPKPIVELENNTLESSQYISINSSSSSENLDSSSNLHLKMHDLILESTRKRYRNIIKYGVKFLWNTEMNIDILDYLDVHCVSTIDPFLYPQMANQPFIAIAYFGGIIAIHKLLYY
ncbi:uncharacterized protein CMU_029900 [Cryptosporidium muris RN66]|uniref:Uncharacterized protein n=1 Tax=Cryptosporidium muris (strain RN66) TaxID=441375 RepID=B6AI73_CRYMR|nr:uncharacterized protein CMU_029900 [Cryptosporidium muris RN66]EEA07914.1 hypothetical protein, conserved [Cryptosporidium muris RN66]|eukprot:XP_002142263.1 hypothetical protein [Cryptosporidium muris RN66]